MLGASPDQAATAYLDPGHGAGPGPAFTGGRLGSSGVMFHTTTDYVGDYGPDDE